ncbi:hypothetical protein GCM10011575_20830 [Microlunatus endophyticus]|uniref:Uncharacterized protein n=1 Tax=Microlunatus endophyticus TaxID=1716077 RepID=A0A917W4L9_9ACTN|nr:hypothetical protein [Microlunatus endophyticus]GGL62126.1 hypothetical protein GCM10011575_20830 [Microlunatus endophyticus]
MPPTEASARQTGASAPARTAPAGVLPGASTSTAAAFSAALVVSAGVGIPVRRLLDCRGPHAVMTGGSVLAVTAVGLIAWSPTLTPSSSDIPGPTAPDSTGCSAIPPRTIASSRQFVLLATGMALAALAIDAALINMIPLLTSNGIRPRMASWLLAAAAAGTILLALSSTPRWVA